MPDNKKAGVNTGVDGVDKQDSGVDKKISIDTNLSSSQQAFQPYGVDGVDKNTRFSKPFLENTKTISTLKVGDRVKPSNSFHERGLDMGTIESIERDLSSIHLRGIRDGSVKLVKNQRSGSLHQYVKKVVGENGEIVEYPKVIGARDRDNINHWNYQLTWKVKIDGKWRTRCRSVPRSKVREIERVLREGRGLAVAIEKLKSSG
jgi:hypothetical protein